MGDDEFQALVEQAIEAIPKAAFAMMDNVIFFIEDEYTPLPGEPKNPEILGLYEGIALTERDLDWGAGALPNRITIFKSDPPGLRNSRRCGARNWHYRDARGGSSLRHRRRQIA